MENWIKVIIISFFALFCHLTLAQSNEQSESENFEFQLLRQNDSIVINTPKKNYKKIKTIPLGKNNSMSFGGSYRFQTEAYINEQFDKNQDQNDYWFLHRGQFHAHLKLGSRFEMFGELNSSLVSSKENISPVDKDELNINQLFVKYQFHDNFNLLVGRQNMRLGTGRLIDVREGSNVRLSFDMAQLQYTDQNTKITGFYAIPVQQQFGVFDNDSFETDETLSALYWTQNWNEKTNTDFYVFHKEEADKSWNEVTANDYRTSVGLRHFGIWKGFNFNNEFVYQLGKFGNETISAWTASIIIDKKFNPVNPFTLGVKTEAISGDKNSNDNKLNSFDALYPIH